MKKLISVATLGLLGIASSASSMTITAMDNANNLAQSLVGAGIVISNVTYTGAATASGYFTGGVAAGIGIANGIVLTSGSAMNLNGTSNTDDSKGTSNGLAGDANLGALVPGYSTYDATVLQFDFVSSGDTAYFNYAFGSDEYTEYANTSFNDVFGFFFEGNNIALIPGTTTPVAINNVNHVDNIAYYNNNDPSYGTPTPYKFEYDGFTDVFTASITGLTAGNTYHIKLAIADSGDTILDSGVFLQAGSFSEEPVNPSVPEPTTILLLGTGLASLAAFGRRRVQK